MPTALSLPKKGQKRIRVQIACDIIVVSIQIAVVYFLSLYFTTPDPEIGDQESMTMWEQT